jgi:2,3-bisphosphoglycerate-independent phosphoglycerate mutase
LTRRSSVLSSIDLTLIDSLAVRSDSKILLVVLDGLGGLPRSGKTELESAWNPNLNNLASYSGLGLLTPIEAGITPGSGPAHLALFGYDPVQYQVGRGVLEALGVGLDVAAGDLCCRANFATLAKDGTVADRRAGRVATDKSTALCRKLQAAVPSIEDVEVIVRPGREHRFVVVFRGPGLEDGLSESDPLHGAERPLEVLPLVAGAAKSARVANEFIRQAAAALAGEPAANFVLLRGLARLPAIPTMRERFRLNPACVASYPMYRGLAKLVGMTVLDAGETWDSEVEAVRRHKPEHDFFFLHFKELDKAGEDGDFDRKQELIERFDEEIVPQLLELKFDVLCITGDHSTPAVMRGHSWHPVPLLISSRFCRPHQRIDEFGERACAEGNIGNIHSKMLMNVLLAHALKLAKFGA